jgi:hypothetical protein
MKEQGGAKAKRQDGMVNQGGVGHGQQAEMGR